MMTNRHRVLIFLLSLSVYMLISSFQQSPGYMDADYHLYMGQRLSSNFAFIENILWNYLDEPSSLPHPSHSYWSPLASMLAALGIRLFPSLDAFQAARMPFIVLAAFVPILTMEIALLMTSKNIIGYWAALFSVAAPFYLPYLLTTDSFSPSMFLGAMFFVILIRAEKGAFSKKSLLLLGIISGFIFLTRAEGLMWIALFLYLMMRRKRKILQGSGEILSLAIGFFLVAGPWWWRNLIVFGQPFAPGAIRTAWLSNYDDLFAFPANFLDVSIWLDQGFGRIVQTDLAAIGQNTISSLVIMGSVFLFPLIIIGALKHRRSLAVKLTMLVWMSSLILMSFIFPFPGVRGGFFHAGAVIQPILWAFAAIGLDRFISWAQEKRRWNGKQAQVILGSGLILILFILSAAVFNSRVIGENSNQVSWNQSAQHYAKIAEYLSKEQMLNHQPIMVNNPPGWALQSKGLAIVIPNENKGSLLELADQFNVSIVILEKNHPAVLEAVYRAPRSYSDFQWIATIDNTHILQILRD